MTTIWSREIHGQKSTSGGQSVQGNYRVEIGLANDMPKLASLWEMGLYKESEILPSCRGVILTKSIFDI
jgi:hypothetical protein